MVNSDSNIELIPRIYRFCDRWCEKCKFTDRCKLYKEDKLRSIQMGSYANMDDLDLKDMLSIAQAALKLLENTLAASIDNNEINDFSDIERKIIEPILKSEPYHKFLKHARTYALLVDKWFDKKRNFLLNKKNEVKKQRKLGINVKQEFVDQLLDIKSAIEIVTWYQHVIFMKQRSILPSILSKQLKKNPNPDHNGKAKVALLSIDKSLTAWETIRNIYPQCTNSILSLMILLDKTRKKIEKYFPEARNFKRPGFDE